MQNLYTRPQELAEALDAEMPDGRWRSVLDLFAPTGVAEASQLQEATGLTRHKLNRALEIMQTCFLGDDPVLRRLDHTIKQPGKANRPPTIYLLAEGGAKLLREQGQEVRACELKEDTPISHAMCLLSVHLAGVQAGKDLVTDSNLAYGNGRVLRPDHRFHLPSGKQVILEVEQAASPALLPRIMESLSNRQAFFQSEAAKEFLPEVRMLLNIKTGASLRRTLNIWETGLRELFKNTGQELVFRLLCLPLETFLEAPEWGETLSGRWEELRLGLQTNQPAENAVPQPTSHSVQTLRNQVVLLQALSQDLDKRLPQAELRPNLLVFQLATTLFGASFDDNPFHAGENSAVPVRSLFLFREFLNMNPELRTKLKQSIHANRGKMVMNQANILHRMNLIIRTFLRYYGWSGRGGIQAHATLDRQTFGDSYQVAVSVDSRYFDEEDTTEQNLVRCALEWMLWALFEYAEDLELGRPEFW